METSWEWHGNGMILKSLNLSPCTIPSPSGNQVFIKHVSLSLVVVFLLPIKVSPLRSTHFYCDSALNIFTSFDLGFRDIVSGKMGKMS